MGHNEAYTRWHWGIEPKKTIEWDDPDYPEGHLIECGRLVELHVREPGERKDTIVRLNRREGSGSHLVFDPNHPYQRLYILLHPDAQRRVRQQYRKNPDYVGGTKYRSMWLSEIAEAAGGRHSTDDYPRVRANPIGILTHVVYATEKKGDGYSQYIHKLGEESGIRPVLASDTKGRLWIAGGNYTSPTPGITD